LALVRQKNNEEARAGTLAQWWAARRVGGLQAREPREPRGSTTRRT